MENLREQEHDLLCKNFTGEFEDYFTAILNKRAELNSIGAGVSENTTRTRVLNALQSSKFEDWKSWAIMVARMPQAPDLVEFQLAGKIEQQRLLGVAGAINANIANAAKCQYPGCEGLHPDLLKCPKREADLKINSKAKANKRAGEKFPWILV